MIAEQCRLAVVSCLSDSEFRLHRATASIDFQTNSQIPGTPDWQRRCNHCQFLARQARIKGTTNVTCSTSQKTAMVRRHFSLKKDPHACETRGSHCRVVIQPKSMRSQVLLVAGANISLWRESGSGRPMMSCWSEAIRRHAAASPGCLEEERIESCWQLAATMLRQRHKAVGLEACSGFRQWQVPSCPFIFSMHGHVNRWRLRC
jgi:hypothetical protein